MARTKKKSKKKIVEDMRRRFGMEKGFHRTQNENEHLHCINACSSSKKKNIYCLWSLHWRFMRLILGTKSGRNTKNHRERQNDRKIKLRYSNGTIEVPLIFCNNFHIQFERNMFVQFIFCLSSHRVNAIPRWKTKKIKEK